MNDTTPRRPAARIITVLLVAGCVSACAGPLGPDPSDYGQPLALERTRRLERLSLDSFQRPAPEGASAQAADAGAGGRGAMNIAPLPARLSPQTVTLGIEDARASGLANNLELKVALVDPSIAAQDVRAEEAKFDLVFRPFVRYQDFDSPTVDVTAPNQRSDIAAGVGVDVPLRTGGRVSVDYSSGRTTAPNPFSTLPEYYGSGLMFSLSQPLLRGAGREVATASIQIASYNEQIVEARTKLRVIAELASIDRAYWTLYATRRELEVRQQQFEVAREQLARADRRVRAGDSPEIELTRAQSGAAERLEAIIRAENAVLIVQRELKRRINRSDLDVSGGATVVTTSQPDLVYYAFDPGALSEMALANRMELLETELAMLADSVNINLARSDALPLLNLDGTYSFDSVAPTFNGSNRVLANRQFQSFTVGLSGEVYLTNEAAEARLRRAVLTRLQRLATKQTREQTVRQEVLDAIDRVGAAWQRIMAARQAAILAGRTLQGEQRQFDAGVRTSTDVLDASARLADAQSSEIRAMADYQISLVDLAVATGTVLGASRVDWSPAGPALLDQQDARRRMQNDADRRREQQNWPRP